MVFAGPSNNANLCSFRRVLLCLLMLMPNGLLGMVEFQEHISVKIFWIFSFESRSPKELKQMTTLEKPWSRQSRLSGIF
uniref:Putative secreted protein n=1 Tax=Anopheles darlingi TaxID=43151 RepID=A0A2M4DNI7_ANODA